MSDSRSFAAFDFFGSPVEVSAVVWALAILVATVVVALVLRHLIIRYSRRQDSANVATWYTLSRLVQYAVVFVGLILSVAVLGLPLSQFSIVAGAIGVGLGFGLQPLFANFISGVVLLVDKSLKVGDFVELESGVTGEVRNIKMLATQIVTNDNIDILVPSSEFVNGRVVNWTYRDVVRRLRVPFAVAYGTDKDLVKVAALEAAAAVPFTLELEGHQRPKVWLSAFGENSLRFDLVVWLEPGAINKPGAVVAAYNWALHSALQAHGIEIPFPQRDINVRTLFGLSGDEARAALRLAPTDARVVPRPSGVSAASDNDAIEDAGG